MSASERLAALNAVARPQIDEIVAEEEERLTRWVREKTGDPCLTVEAGSPMLTIARALPEIVAVVKAAEEQAPRLWDPRALNAALAALEEKLEDK